MRIGSILAIAALAIAAPLHAQETAADAVAAAPAATPDPARVEAARRVVELVLPEAEARALLSSLVGDAFDQQILALNDDTEFKRSMREFPQLRTRFDRFISDMRGVAQTIFAEATPGLIETTVIFYAQRYSVDELAEIERFLATPTGQRYARDGFTVLQDPQMLRWQRDLSGRLEERAGPMLQAFIADITRLAAKDTGQ